MRISAEGGFGITSKRVMRSDLSVTAKAVYALLSTYASARSRRCWPSRERLAEDLGLSERTISRAIDELVASGYAKRSSRGLGASKYTVLLDWVQVCGEDTSDT